MPVISREGFFRWGLWTWCWWWQDVAWDENESVDVDGVDGGRGWDAVGEGLEDGAELAQLSAFEDVRGASAVETFVGAGFFRVVGRDAGTEGLLYGGSDGDAG